MKEVKLSGKLHNVIEKYKQKSDTKEFVLLNDFFFFGWLMDLKEGNCSKRNQYEAIAMSQERSSDCGIL